MRQCACVLRAEISEARSVNSTNYMVTPFWPTRVCGQIVAYHICGQGEDAVRHEVSALLRMVSPKMAALVIFRGVQRGITLKPSGLTRRLRTVGRETPRKADAAWWGARVGNSR